LEVQNVSVGIGITLAEGKKVADMVIARLSPFCERIQVAGSIRRERPRVNDVDIVLIPNDFWGLAGEMRTMGAGHNPGFKRIEKVTHDGFPVDLYLATRESWATLLLIRTGSKEHNIRLCSRARAYGMKLRADGAGLFQLATNQTEYEDGEDTRIAGDSEESIYEALGLRYLKPTERES
jgi:DNA polymerase (family 10)